MSVPASRDQPPATDTVARIKRVVRFALPWHATVAVISQGQNDLLDLEGRRTWDLSFSDRARRKAIDLARVDAALAEGGDFLLLPVAAQHLLHQQGQLGERLRGCRVVRNEKDLCTILALRDLEDEWFVDHPAPDGLPLPPAELRALVIGNYDSKRFYYGGLQVVEHLQAFLSKNELSFESFESILDFGCGCGRVMRHLHSLSHKGIHGADYNPYQLEWCRENLSFAAFERTTTGTCLTYPNDSLDFILGFSVFTHLDSESQDFWIEELRRSLSPGGFLLLTLQGSSYRPVLDEHQRQIFDSGGMVIRDSEWSGSSACAAFHPESYVRNVLAAGFTLVDYAPEAMRNQDGVLLRKPD